MKNCITRMEIIPNSINILINSCRGHWFVVVATTIVLLLAYFFNHILPQQRCTKHLPPGSLGFPLIGETISYAGAVKRDKVNEWVKARQSRYGPVFKTSLVGVNTVVMTGSAGNRFILGGGGNGLLNHLPPAALRVIGKRSLSALSGPAHKPIRGAIMSFLKPDSIHGYVNRMSSLIQEQLLQELRGKDSVCLTPLMKKLTFKLTCSLLFGLSGDTELEELRKSYTLVLNGTWSLPLNFPGTDFAKAIKARAKISEYFSVIVERKKREFAAGELCSGEDVISKFVCEGFSEEEILDNIVSLMIASHETSSTVVTLCMRQLGRNDDIYHKVLQEHEEVVKVRNGNGGEIRWSEMQMMKYTWRFAQEVMRLIPPVTGTFKIAERDISFGDFIIPKGWQLLWAAPSSHMDENIFKDPERFDPTRFENPSAIPPYSYVAFGAGPRVCPGSEFARIQILLILHHMVTNYQWDEKCPNERIERGGMPYLTKGLPVKLIPRKL